jgi:hypothetical protein
VQRLETLAALAAWEEADETEAALAYRASTQDEILRVIAVLADQIQKQQVG